MMAPVPQAPEMPEPLQTTPETALIAIPWPYPKQMQLPQRWAVNPWGEACWTYMALWTPKALIRLQERLRANEENPAVFFHELGETIQIRQQRPPRLSEWWRNPPAPPPEAAMLALDPVTLLMPEREMQAAHPPPPTALPEAFYAAPDPTRAMADSLKEISGLVFHVLEMLPHVHRETIEELVPLCPESSSLLQDLPLAQSPADRMQAQQDLEDLQSLSESIVTKWDKATAAWCATLTILYQSPNLQLPRPLTTEIMHYLVSSAVPPLALPSMPAQMDLHLSLPPVPEARLDAFTDLRLEL